METSMSDPLARLFDQFLKERIYLKAVTPKTRIWYDTAWKAFNTSQTATGERAILPVADVELPTPRRALGPVPRDARHA
jgi:hypothetical protein